MLRRRRLEPAHPTDEVVRGRPADLVTVETGANAGPEGLDVIRDLGFHGMTKCEFWRPLHTAGGALLFGE